jgi:pSer/pThr/pTyr-binding forkhead associated (FHA) protein
MRLRVLEPVERRGRTFDLGDEVTLGRASGCGVPLDDAFTSQLHARLFRRNGETWIEDLGSTNGTFVNAKKLGSPVLLHLGDRLQVGRTVLEVGP